jgi:hypothetical protein
MTTPAPSWAFLAKFKPPRPNGAFIETVLATRPAPDRSTTGGSTADGPSPGARLPPSFDRLAGWLAQWHVLLDADLLLLDAEQCEWNKRLAELGGDPATLDFSAFRPLRLSREEDWSDWLAHLLETSQTGRLAANLFAGGRTTSVRREVSLDGGARRADLLLHWGDSKATHLEVKVGDESFEKTYETAEHVEHENPRLTWRHLVLLVPRQLKVWQQTTGARTNVGVVTWEEVAIGLRRELWEAAEAVSWLVWALTFCAAIEQTLLGMPHLTGDARARPDSATAASRARRLPILRRARQPEAVR